MPVTVSMVAKKKMDRVERASQNGFWLVAIAALSSSGASLGINYRLHSVVIVFVGLADLDARPRIEAVGSTGNHLLRSIKTVEDLHIQTVRDA